MSDAGWNSGSMGTSPAGYDPAGLVVQVRRLLEKRGVAAAVPPGGLNEAISAASDLLLCLGVEPKRTHTGAAE